MVGGADYSSSDVAATPPPPPPPHLPSEGSVLLLGEDVVRQVGHAAAVGESAVVLLNGLGHLLLAVLDLSQFTTSLE